MPAKSRWRGYSLSRDARTSNHAGAPARLPTASRDYITDVSVPTIRITAANARPVRPARDYVLYWMIATRRRRANFGLQRAVERARALGKPLLVFEPLRADYPWASDRFDDFVISGMADNARSFARTPVRYYPYVEPRPGAGKGLLPALARRACLVVTDEFPCFFLPRMVRAAAKAIDVRLEQVDSNGILPLRATDRAFSSAYAFRRHVHAALAEHWTALPERDPLSRVRLPRPPRLPRTLLTRWPPLSRAALAQRRGSGGASAGRRALRRFLAGGLDRYAAMQRHPDAGATSSLSPWLHFGHLAAHEVFLAVTAREGWTPADLVRRERGRRAGWGLGANAAGFVDQLVTWRELGFNAAAWLPRYDRYGSLPDWARKTLAAHASDPRPWRYRRAQLAAADTHDEIWNAAQRQLVTEGRLHNYLRMLWGKKILEWSRSPREALATMVELNNRYALDGRDPNSYSGIFWVLGRYDRPWGPERPIYGTIRYMSSDATRRKLEMDEYLRRFSAPD